MMLMGSGVEAASTSAPSPTDKPSTELAGSAAQSAGRAGQTSVSLDSHHPSAAIADVSVSGTSRLDKEHLLELLPELKKDHADIKKLSRQIQLINDTGSIKLHTRFRPAADGRYNVIIDAEDVQRSFFGLGIANSGNVYTGNWRTTASWIKTGAGRGADTFGAAYVTSPSGGHLSDVKQAAISYRAVLPKSADTLTFTASWSDVTLDMDQASLAGLDINAGGRGTAAGLHYRHNFSYTSRNKDFLDIGYDHKHTSDDQSINFAGVMLRRNSVMGFGTLLIAHITFDMPYVILSVMPKLTQMDPDLEEAALDLGCTPVKAFFRVVIHEIMPGIISGALMAFTMSLDDFVISYFVYGPNFVTLPVEIYNYTKKPLQPKIYALFTLLFLVILLLMVLMNLLQLRDARQRQIRKGGAS